MTKMETYDVLKEIKNILSSSKYFYCIDTHSCKNHNPVMRCNKSKRATYSNLEEFSIYGVDIVEYADDRTLHYAYDSYIELGENFRLATQEEIESFEANIIMEELQ